MSEVARMRDGIRTVLDVYDTNGEEALAMADAIRSVLHLHQTVRQRGGFSWCDACRLPDDTSCPTVRRIAEHLGVGVGGV